MSLVDPETGEVVVAGPEDMSAMAKASVDIDRTLIDVCTDIARKLAR